MQYLSKNSFLDSWAIKVNFYVYLVALFYLLTEMAGWE